MPALQVRECPNELYEKLRACASNEKRSLSQQTLVILEDYLSQIDRKANTDNHAEAPSPAEASSEQTGKRKEIFARLNTIPAISLPDDFDVVEFVHQAREERW